MTAKQKRTLSREDDRLSLSHDALTGLLEELQESFDAKTARSEKWQDSESGAAAQSDIDAVQSVLDLIETARDEIDALENPDA